VTVPAVAVEGLGTHHDIFDGIFVAANAVGLNDLPGSSACPDGNRYVPCRERVDILGALPSLFQVIDNLIFMRKVAVHAFGEFFVRGMVPVLVLRIHDMAICTRLWRASPIGGCVGHKDKKSERKDCCGMARIIGSRDMAVLWILLILNIK